MGERDDEFEKPRLNIRRVHKMDWRFLNHIRSLARKVRFVKSTTIYPIHRDSNDRVSSPSGNLNAFRRCECRPGSGLCATCSRRIATGVRVALRRESSQKSKLTVTYLFAACAIVVILRIHMSGEAWSAVSFTVLAIQAERLFNGG